MKKTMLILGTMTFGESVFAPDVETFIRAYLDTGGCELDTAYVYNEGQCEKLLGEVLPSLGRPCRIATKANPRITGRLDGDAARMQLEESLRRLRLSSVDTFYLHFPDPATPVESVLETCDALYREGKFRELGLSNFPAWMVADVWHLCKARGWVKPTVYEGVYNPLARKAEAELDACLDRFGLRFTAYNPLAGGLLTGRYRSFEEAPTDGRFTHRPNYQSRYWKKRCFEAMETIRQAAEEHGMTVIEATYRWLVYHSMLRSERGDAVIIGASELSHLTENMEAVNKGPLSGDMAAVFETAWSVAAPDSPQYFTLYRGKGSVGGESK